MGPVEPVRRKFVDDSVDTSGFLFIPEDPKFQGPPKPKEDEERHRLDTLTTLMKISDTEDPVVMSMCKLIRSLMRVPVAGVSILDEDRCWFRTPEGVQVFPKNLSLCGYQLVPEKPTVLVIEDMTSDERSKELPYVVHDPQLRFYASAPLVASNGCRLGTMCVVDLQPRKLTQEQFAMLANFAECMVRQLEKDNHVVLQKKTVKGLGRSLDVVLSPVILVDTTDADWVIKHVNEGFGEVSGFERDDLVEKKFWDCFSPVGKTKEEAKKALQVSVIKESDFDVQVRSIKGKTFTIHMKPSNAGLIDEHALPIVTPRGAMKAKDQAVELPTPPIYFGSVPETLTKSDGTEDGKPSNGSAKVVATPGSLPTVETPFANKPTGEKAPTDAAKAGCQCLIC